MSGEAPRRPGFPSHPKVVPLNPRARRRAIPPAPQVKILLSLGRPHRQALKGALQVAVSDAPGGPWQIRVTSKIVYATPTAGDWWLKVTLLPKRGEVVTLLVDPEHQSPALVAAAVRAAVRGGRP